MNPLVFGSQEANEVAKANKELTLANMHKGERRAKECGMCDGTGVCSECDGKPEGDNCYCQGDGTCLMCDGAGSYETEWRKGEFGWDWYAIN